MSCMSRCKLILSIEYVIRGGHCYCITGSGAGIGTAIGNLEVIPLRFLCFLKYMFA